ncbi:uncharacterized protein [Montipora capricornis]|uniref:uncharacterized protein isoform X1 n=1 Tax=Montipora capricornis TaxID=246305 RepID=UPI0035F20CDE
MIFLLLFCLFIALIIPSGSTTVTFSGRYLPRSVERTVLLDVDWMECLQACHSEPGCISYNYHKDEKVCEMNSNGEREGCGGKRTIVSKDWIFHQIRPAPKKPVKYELGDDQTNPADSCQKIFDNRRNASSKAYYIKTIAQKRSLIYCKMVYSNSDGCSKGGWTLAMKINGHKGTFSYHSDLWATDLFNEAAGKDLSETETKVDVFQSLTLQKGFCVGMEVNGTTKWLEIPHNKNGETAMAIFTLTSHTRVNVGRDKWKSLISGSFVNESCSASHGQATVKEGFNLNEDRDGKVRIGMVTLCNNKAVSRIGFGMDINNTCRVIAMQDGISLKAFCYVFIR